MSRLYGPVHRSLQERFDTRRLADNCSVTGAPYGSLAVAVDSTEPIREPLIAKRCASRPLRACLEAAEPR